MGGRASSGRLHQKKGARPAGGGQRTRGPNGGSVQERGGKAKLCARRGGDDGQSTPAPPFARATAPTAGALISLLTSPAAMLGRIWGCGGEGARPRAPAALSHAQAPSRPASRTVTARGAHMGAAEPLAGPAARCISRALAACSLGHPGASRACQGPEQGQLKRDHMRGSCGGVDGGGRPRRCAEASSPTSDESGALTLASPPWATIGAPRPGLVPGCYAGSPQALPASLASLTSARCSAPCPPVAAAQHVGSALSGACCSPSASLARYGWGVQAGVPAGRCGSPCSAGCGCARGRAGQRG